MVGREAARGREGYRAEIQFSYFVSYSSSMWSTDYSFWLCSSLLWFIVPSLRFFFCVFFFFLRKNIPSSFSLCKWFLNSDCFYDSAMLKQSKPPSQPSASVTCLHLTQGAAMEICSTIYWCIKILQEGHNIKSAAAVGIASSIWVVWLIW